MLVFTCGAVPKLFEGVLFKRVAKGLLNKIRENGAFQEHALINIAHHENQESTSLEGSLPHLWRQARREV